MNPKIASSSARSLGRSRPRLLTKSPARSSVADSHGRVGSTRNARPERDGSRWAGQWIQTLGTALAATPSVIGLRGQARMPMSKISFTVSHATANDSSGTCLQGYGAVRTRTPSAETPRGTTGASTSPTSGGSGRRPRSVTTPVLRTSRYALPGQPTSTSPRLAMPVIPWAEVPVLEPGTTPAGRMIAGRALSGSSGGRG